MKTDMHMDVTPAVFRAPPELFQTEEIIPNQLIQAVDGVTDIALDDVTVEQCQIVGFAFRTPDSRLEMVHIKAVRMLLKQISRAWACLYF
ncbi:hypothetical protein [Salinicoccus sp. YB14-2]|uniref:hypothetical protein n=1 Tax=Salinicoccus sp. YB14-2 TaxID=1572701 RepID=UPI00068C8749|nr:hypothetical protein [Salinicoccus sp. YB14-2]